MPRKLHRLADQVTAARLAMLPALWVLALLRRPVALGLGLIVAGSTDLLDGALARRSGKPTRFGSQLDSIADVLLMGSTVVWLVLLRGDFFRGRTTSLLVWLALAVAAFVVGWVRFRHVADLHLYSTKVSTFMGNTFSIALLIFGRVPDVIWDVVIGGAIVASGELLVVQLVRSRVDEHIGTILRLRRGRAHAG